MQSIATTTGARVEVISAYAATNQTVDAVDEVSAWNVIGSFYLPLTTSARVELVGLVSGAPLVLSMRLFDLTAAAPVSGTTVAVDGTAEERAVSGTVQLQGGRIYQFQAEVLGASGFGVVKNATLV